MFGKEGMKIMELLSTGKFKFLGVRQFTTKNGKTVYIGQFHDGHDIYEFFLDVEILPNLPNQFEDVEITFELTKYNGRPSVRLKSVSKLSKLAVGGN